MARDPMNGLPGMGTERTSEQRSVLASEQGAVFLPRGVIIDGSEARDPGNSYGVDILRAGLLLGKITSGGLFAPSVLGGLAAAYDASADTTEMTVSAAVAVEMVRRLGASGTFKLTGPPTAAGIVQTATVTYSAINVTTGVITITALSVDVDEVQTITFDAAMTAGELAVTYYTPDGEPIIVSVAWNTDIATTLAAWNVASTAAATVWAGEASVGAVMTGTATIPILTFSGVGFAGLPPTDLAEADVDGTTGPTGATVVKTTAAEEASGAGSYDFVIKSLVQPTDGSEQPRGIISDGPGHQVTAQDRATSVDIGLPLLCVGGVIKTAQIVNYPTDTSLEAWLKAQLRLTGYGYLFDDDFAA